MLESVKNVSTQNYVDNEGANDCLRLKSVLLKFNRSFEELAVDGKQNVNICRVF